MAGVNRNVSERETLAGLANGGPTYKRVLTVQDCGDAWQVIDAYSYDNRPFRLALEPSSGSGKGTRILITATAAVRVCVPGGAVILDVANLSTLTNRVRVGRVGSSLPLSTRNTYEDLGTGTGTSSVVEHTIPPYAHRLRVDIADPTVRTTSVLTLVDGETFIRCSLPLTELPPDGLPLGGAAKVQIAAPNTTRYRLAYELAL